MPLFVSAPMRNPHCRSGHQQQATAPNFVDQLVEAWRCIQRLSQCGECADSCTAMARVVQQAVKCDNSCLQGLLHFDGIDSMGRPIIIVNARAAAASDISLRPLAVKYMMQRLDPIVYAVRTYSRPTSPQASGMQMGFLSAAQVFRRVSNMTVIAPRAYTDMQFKASQVTRTCVRCQIFLCHESCFLHGCRDRMCWCSLRWAPLASDRRTRGGAASQPCGSSNATAGSHAPTRRM